MLDLLKKWWVWIGLTVLVYGNTFKHEYVIDDIIVVNNNSLTQQGISGIPEIFKHSYLYGYNGRDDESYRPLTLVTFAIERSLFSADPTISHIIQVLLYGLCVLILFKLLIFVFGEENRRWISIVCLLFLVHPIHTEVVANVKSRDELLCAIFLFSSLLYYLKWVRSFKIYSLIIALVFYFFATISKETAIPSVLIFPVLMWFSNSFNMRQITLKSIWILIPLIIYISIRSAVLSNVLIKDEIDPVANSLALAQTSGELFATNFSIFLKYIQLALVPLNLSWDYSVAEFPIIDFSKASAISGLILFIGLLFMLIFGFVKKKIAGIGAFIFFVTFIATSNFVFLINCNLGERFLFIPILGLLLILVPTLDSFIERKLGVKTVYIFFLSIISLFVVRTIVRNNDWKNNQMIYEAGVRVSKNSVKAHFNLGTEYLTLGNKTSNLLERKEFYERALVSFDRAMEIYPKYANIYENSAFVYSEISKITENDSDKTAYLKKGITALNFALDSLKMTKSSLYVNKYAILMQLITQQKDSVARDVFLNELLYTISQKADFNAEDFHHEVYALQELKKYNELIQLIEDKADEFPEKTDIVAEVGRQSFARSDFVLSLRIMDQYLKMRPEDLSSLSNKGMLLEILGKKEEALKVYEEVLKRDPNQQHARQLYDKLVSNP